jgi:hypothetical protein
MFAGGASIGWRPAAPELESTGGGAFYWRATPPPGARRLQVRRYYRQALAEGFPSPRHAHRAQLGQYRLLPSTAAASASPGATSSSATGAISPPHHRAVLSSRVQDPAGQLGPEAPSTASSPLATAEADVVDKREEKRRFYAYINRNGSLINEGIVVTSELVARLATEEAARFLYPLRYEGRGYVALALDLPDGRCLAGLRKLGIVKLKGLEPLACYELVDGGPFAGGLQPLLGVDLMTALERDYASALTEASSA